MEPMGIGSSRVWLAILCVACGCSSTPPCSPGPSPLRRLTRDEYNNTVRDWLKDASKPGDDFPSEDAAGSFNNDTSSQSISPVLAEAYLRAAEGVTDRTVKNGLLPSCSGRADEKTCASQAIAALGAQAFRRPLSGDDLTFFTDVFSQARLVTDASSALQEVLQVMLQSPEYLYRIERGTPTPQPGVFKLDDYEVASRLSYLIWGSLPDETLFKAAAAGGLNTQEQVESQARRMLEDPRARETVREFHAQWLGLSRIDDIAKDTAAFPDFDPTILPLLRAEADRFMDAAIFEDKGDLKTLFTAPYTYINDTLARYYQLPAPGTNSLVRVELSPERASGLFTQAGLLAVLAKPNQTSPVRRGKFVREQLLCQHIPPPPDNVILIAPNPDPKLNAKERFAAHRNSAFCNGCHRLMDPIGFSFEKYDGLGRYRATENGRDIDDDGEVVDSSIGKYDSVPDLMSKLVDSSEVQKCVTQQWFRFAAGRSETEDDACTLNELAQGFSDGSHRVPELLIALTKTSAFLYRTESNQGER